MSLVLNWDEDFQLDAHVEADGQQRFIVSGFIQKQRAGGLYRAPLIPALFFGADGSQLSSWSQYLTAGNHTILRREGGKPYVPDGELYWQKVSAPNIPAPAPVPRLPPVSTIPTALDMTPILILLFGVPIGLYILFKALK